MNEMDPVAPATSTPPASRADHAYTAPVLTPLGTVEAVTGGPNPNGGNIDQLVGGVGGFRETEPTS